ncbi:acyl-CoA reductase [Pedobacter sp. ASV28]|uniref:acyl-CoA reductase n=1 Tax=Pedobacter sp. ASV28 TaxID=2795123 RepID=UPI0018EC598A|nr:acyl-CoA reductase [Pedobacter sp. ASV28]
MSSLHKEHLISAFKQLGEFMANPNEAFKTVVKSANHHNAWFTEEEVNKSLLALSNMLNEADLKQWFSTIEISKSPKKIGLILAGNIPLVGFHDVLCVLATGNIAQIKLSSSDDKLLPALLQQLVIYEPLLLPHIIYAERLKDFDAVIATGSNNTSRYFEYYFGKVPNIIRKNRNSIGILTGQESALEIEALGHDLFDYFGMGCRSVSKLYIPQGYDIRQFFEPLEKFQPIINHFKYNNNYDYNKSIYLVNLQPHFDNGFMLLKEEESFSSPLAVLYYETYTDLAHLAKKLNDKIDDIQCIVAKTDLNLKKAILGFGESQNPKLWDYADEVNTIYFLNNLAG